MSGDLRGILAHDPRCPAIHSQRSGDCCCNPEVQRLTGRRFAEGLAQNRAQRRAAARATEKALRKAKQGGAR